MKILLVDAIDSESTNKPYENGCEGLALPCLAAYLRSHVDNLEMKIINSRFMEELSEFTPDIVAISFVTINFFIAKEYAALAKSHGIKVVAGGPHLSAAPQTLPDEIDIAVIGEGEETLLELVRMYHRSNWESKDELVSINGIAFRDGDGEIRITGRREPLNLDTIPMPARDLLFHERRGIISSRGCPYLCSFCFRAHLDRRVRYAAPEKVVAEIVYLVKTYDLKHIIIYDDMFTFPRKRFNQIVDSLVDAGITENVSFNCNIRPNDLDEDVARQLKRLNVTRVFLGIESGVQRTLSYLKPQNATVEQNEKALSILKENKIFISGGIIIGAPDETCEEILETLHWLKRSQLDSFEIMLLTPLPGTAVWNDALERGLVSYDMDWSRLDIRTNELCGKNPVIVSKTLTLEQLLGLYRVFISEKARWEEVYLGKTLFKRAWELLVNPGEFFKKITKFQSYTDFIKQLTYLGREK